MTTIDKEATHQRWQGESLYLFAAKYILITHSGLFVTYTFFLLERQQQHTTTIAMIITKSSATPPTMTMMMIIVRLSVFGTIGIVVLGELGPGMLRDGVSVPTTTSYSRLRSRPVNVTLLWFMGTVLVRVWRLAEGTIANNWIWYTMNPLAWTKFNGCQKTVIELPFRVDLIFIGLTAATEKRSMQKVMG